jgi:hypothetical protein
MLLDQRQSLTQRMEGSITPTTYSISRSGIVGALQRGVAGLRPEARLQRMSMSSMRGNSSCSSLVDTYVQDTLQASKARTGSSTRLQASFATSEEDLSSSNVGASIHNTSKRTTSAELEKYQVPVAKFGRIKKFLHSRPRGVEVPRQTLLPGQNLNVPSHHPLTWESYKPLHERLATCALQRIVEKRQTTDRSGHMEQKPMGLKRLETIPDLREVSNTAVAISDLPSPIFNQAYGEENMSNETLNANKFRAPITFETSLGGPNSFGRPADIRQRSTNLSIQHLNGEGVGNLGCTSDL